MSLQSQVQQTFEQLKAGMIPRGELEVRASEVIGSVSDSASLEHLLHLLSQTKEYAITQEDRILRKFLMIYCYKQLVRLQTTSEAQYLLAIGKLLCSKPVPDFGSAGRYLESARELGVYDGQSIELIAISRLIDGAEEACIEGMKTYLTSHPLDRDCLRSFIRMLKVIDRFEEQSEILRREIERGKEPVAAMECLYAQSVLEMVGRSEYGKLKAWIHSTFTSDLSKAILFEEEGDFDKAIKLAKASRRDSFFKDFAETLIQRCSVKASLVKKNTGKKKSRKPLRVALLLSGFLRDYDYCCNIREFIDLNEGYQIDVFISLFDRMGDIYLSDGMPRRYFDYQHGGFYRETSKTRLVNQPLIHRLFDPVICEFEDRKPDEHYLKSIGMEHPQWAKVYDSMLLMKRHEKQENFSYDVVARGRFDLAYKNIVLSSLDFSKTAVYTPQNHVFGPPGYSICDRFAVGNREVMEIYCEIGKGKTFIELESDEAWKDTALRRYGPMHEAHLAYWLRKNSIAIETPENLFI